MSDRKELPFFTLTGTTVDFSDPRFNIPDVLAEYMRSLSHAERMKIYRELLVLTEPPSSKEKA